MRVIGSGGTSVSVAWTALRLNGTYKTDYFVDDTNNKLLMDYGTDGATNGTGLVFTSASPGVGFSTSIPATGGVPNNPTWVFNETDGGSFQISTVDSNTQLTLSSAMSANLTGKTYRIRILGESGGWIYVGVTGSGSTTNFIAAANVIWPAISGASWGYDAHGLFWGGWDSAAEPSLTSDMYVCGGFADHATAPTQGGGGGIAYTASQRRPGYIFTTSQNFGIGNTIASDQFYAWMMTQALAASGTRPAIRSCGAVVSTAADQFQDASNGIASAAAIIGADTVYPCLALGRTAGTAGLAVAKFKFAYAWLYQGTSFLTGTSPTWP